MIAALEIFATAIDCTVNAEACGVLWDAAKDSVNGTVEAIRRLPEYPQLLKNTDLAVARFADGKISREEFVTVLADSGRIAGTAESVVVSLGLGGGLAAGMKVAKPTGPNLTIRDHYNHHRDMQDHVVANHGATSECIQASEISTD